VGLAWIGAEDTTRRCASSPDRISPQGAGTLDIFGIWRPLYWL